MFIVTQILKEKIDIFFCVFKTYETNERKHNRSEFTSETASFPLHFIEKFENGSKKKPIYDNTHERYPD